MKEKKSCVFLILHYKEELSVLRKCTGMIQALKGSENTEIVIVDNVATEESRKELEKACQGTDRVTLLYSPENQGFSKGNNLGYAYIREHFQPDFLVVMNPDVYITQTDFLEKLYELEKETGFFVAGPDVYEPVRGAHTSPLGRQLMLEENIKRYGVYLENTKKAIRENPEQFRKQYFLDQNKNNPLLQTLRRAVTRVRRREVQSWRERQEDVQLQGSCVIFSKAFVEGNEKAFEPETFLYEEEHLLWLRCRRNGWKEIYLPELKVLHMGQESSGLRTESFEEYLEKKYRQHENMQKALEIYYDYWKECRSISQEGKE